MISCLADSALAMLDEKACRSWWLRRLHPAGPMCPACGVSVTGTSVEGWAAGKLLHCRDCGKWFDYRTGTPLSGLKTDWKRLTLLVTLLSIGLHIDKIARICQISDDTVRRLAKRLGAAGA